MSFTPTATKLAQSLSITGYPNRYNRWSVTKDGERSRVEITPASRKQQTEKERWWWEQQQAVGSKRCTTQNTGQSSAVSTQNAVNQPYFASPKNAHEMPAEEITPADLQPQTPPQNEIVTQAFSEGTHCQIHHCTLLQYLQERNEIRGKNMSQNVCPIIS